MNSWWNIQDCFLSPPSWRLVKGWLLWDLCFKEPIWINVQKLRKLKRYVKDVLQTLVLVFKCWIWYFEWNCCKKCFKKCSDCQHNFGVISSSRCIPYTAFYIVLEILRRAKVRNNLFLHLSWLLKYKATSFFFSLLFAPYAQWWWDEVEKNSKLSYSLWWHLTVFTNAI